MFIEKMTQEFILLFYIPIFNLVCGSLGNVATSHLLPLCLLLNNVVRIITQSNTRTPIDYLYLELNLLPLYTIVHHRIALLIYKYHHGRLPTALHDWYMKNNMVHQYRTRQHNILRVPSGTHTNIFSNLAY